jgi:hypothetical protein
VGNELGVFLVRLVPLELAGRISLDTSRIHNADLVTGFVQEQGQFITIAAGCLQAGVEVIHLPLFQPLPQSNEPHWVVVEGGQTIFILSEEGYIELVLGDIDTQNIHEEAPRL